jgi:enoyl-CoA hydratase/carnithine racemase
LSEHIKIERRGAVQVIRLDRPEKKNAITRAMYVAMTEALKAGDDDPAVRCNVFLGVPGAFSAGNDLADFLAYSTEGKHGSEAFELLEALARAEKPIVSGVDGIAVGVGTTLHFHCDLTFATPRTFFHAPFVDLGLTPEAGSSLIAPLLMGRQQAFALLGLGEPFSAERAKACGLIYEIVGEGELEKAVFQAAERVAAKPPEALRIARDLMRGDREDLVARIREESRLFAVRLTSDEAKAAFQAFMARKKPA